MDRYIVARLVNADVVAVDEYIVLSGVTTSLMEYSYLCFLSFITASFDLQSAVVAMAVRAWFLDAWSCSVIH